MKVGDLVNFTLADNTRTVVLLISMRVNGKGRRIWNIAQGGEVYEVTEPWLTERK